MTAFRLSERGVRAILLDIEGTTTPVEFVYDVLFPFARAHLREYLLEHAHSEPLRDVLRHLRDEWRNDVASHEDPPQWHDDSPLSSAPYFDWLMDRDRKSPALKQLQGRIWEAGYRSGALKGSVFRDVRPAFERWRTGGVEIAIYSSGSVLAQRLLFGATADGDLTTFISRFFDTAVGAKTSPQSFRRITSELNLDAGQVLFVSDVTEELDAATAAGCQALLAIRPGNRSTVRTVVEMIRSFDQIV